MYTMAERNKASITEWVSKSKSTSDAKATQNENQADRRRAELEMKIRYRVACEAKAFDIVNRLIEETVSEEYLQECCRFIDGNHYADIVQERAIVHICGYPVCNRNLEPMPKKKYHISTKSNTVYDITERKNFCSNQCYKASKHLAKQVPDTPVWSREKDTIRKIQFLSTTNNRGALGEEVIGSQLFTLKEELRALERLDQLSSPDASLSRGHATEGIDQTAENRPDEAPRQKRVSENLSVSSSRLTERSDLRVVSDDMNVRMAQLALDSEGGRERSEICRKDPSSAADCVQATNQGAEDVGLLACSSPQKILPEMQTLADKAGSISHLLSTAEGKEAVRATNNTAMFDSAVLDSKISQSQHAMDSDDDDGGENDVDGTSHESCTQSLSEDDSVMLRKTNIEELSTVNMSCGNSNSCTSVPAGKHQPLPSTSQPQRDSSPIKCSQSHSKPDSDQCKVRVSETAVKKIAPANAVCSKDSKDSKTSFGAKSKARVDVHKTATSTLDSVCRIIHQWITQETLQLLGLSARKGLDFSMKLGPMHGDAEMQQKYRDLCQRLAGQEKDFEEFLGVEDILEEGTVKSLQPVPNFLELQKKMQEYQLRVKEFYGDYQLPASRGRIDGGDNFESMAANKPLVLPAVDSYNQLLIRRRIVLERLDRVMPILLPPLGLSVQDVSSVLREIVFTFSFTNKNIIFQPAEWSLVGILLLKMLASNSSLIASAFEKSGPIRSFALVLQKLGHSSESLGNLVTEMLLDCQRQLQ